MSEGDLLLLRMEGPMMSFGDVAVDALGPTARFPQQSMVVGILANALGVERRQPEVLDGLQASLAFAAREDRRGEVFEDYQTVDLSAAAVSLCGWTTRGTLEQRGGASGDGTHVRRRQYLADASYLVAVAVRPVRAGLPGIDDIERALRSPFRPLFLGRKNCAPTRPVLHGRRRAATLYAALLAEPAPARYSPPGLRAWWPDGEGPAGGETVFAHDLRNHAAGVHMGRRALRTGLMRPAVAA